MVLSGSHPAGRYSDQAGADLREALAPYGRGQSLIAVPGTTTKGKDSLGEVSSVEMLESLLPSFRPFPPDYIESGCVVISGGGK